MRTKTTRPRTAIDLIQKGHLIMTVAGPRKVRAVTHYSDGRLREAIFTKVEQRGTSPCTAVPRARLRRSFRGILLREVPLRATPQEARMQDAAEALRRKRDAEYAS